MVLMYGTIAHPKTNAGALEIALLKGINDSVEEENSLMTLKAMHSNTEIPQRFAPVLLLRSANRGGNYV